MKNSLLLILLVVVSLGCAHAHVNKVVAVVNNDVITQHELTQKTALISQQLRLEHKTMSSKDIESKVLEDMIDNLLQLQLASRFDITVSKQDLDVAIADVARRNGLSLAKLKAALQHDGINYTVFCQQIHEQMLIGKVHEQALLQDIHVSAEEVVKFLHEHPTITSQNNDEAMYHIEDMVISLPDNPNKAQPKALKEFANNLRRKIGKVSDFNKVATANANNTVEVQNRDLGWRKASDLPTIFVSTISNKHAGDIVGPIEAANGFHIIRLTGVRGGQEVLKLNKQQAQELIYKEKLAAKLVPWLKELRAKAYIKVTL